MRSQADRLPREAAGTGDHPATLDSRLLMITAVCTLLPVMVTLDATVVNVAQRTFIDRFSSTQAVVAWTVTAFTLALAAVIPFTGWAANRLGTKRLVLGSVLLFSIGSLLCALASNIVLLVAFRGLQGLGGGMLLPLQLIILARAAGPQLLGRVLTIGMVPVLLAPICGPILGGWLIDAFGWQWIFLINIPIGLLTLVLAVIVLPRDVPVPAEPLDMLGMVLLSPGLVLLFYGMSLLPNRAAIADSYIWVPAATGLLLIVAFVVHALRRADHPLIDLRLLNNREVAAANAIRFLFAASFFGCCLLFPGYFQQVLSKTPLESGLLLIPQTLGAAAVVPIVGRLLEQHGARGIVLTGTTLTVMGMGVFVYGTSRDHVDLSVLLTGLAMFGVGSACMMTPVSWAAVRTLKPSEVAHGSTLLTVNHNTAASIGAALMSVILTARFNGNADIAAANRAAWIRDEAARMGLPADLSRLPSQVLAPDFPARLANDLSRAYAGVFAVATILLAATAIPGVLLPKRPAHRGDAVHVDPLPT
ncbi:Multidrug export protein EmrB [Mycobacterium simulans]|uniref:DHA2 family efflux MFS transporter permease subunit n=1 Tax=Mycobacterium simulans TaxID=627089 RepID=UPI001748A533|nr:DHA2 family efflux MFS transporter permease subunit [Mycobacterium simulans]SON60577.1 Multidrug export protein EmrB [Mycobacterium simulans]